MIIKNIFLFSLFISCAYIGKALNITAITSAENGGVYAYNALFESFNKYSLENNLNITLKLNLLSKENSTAGVAEYESMIEYLLKKQRTTKYDIIYYDNIFSRKFSPYLVDLQEYLPEEHIQLYQNDITKQTCYYDNKLIGLPTVVDFNVLYYNEKYLKKYNKNPPKTWKELLEIGNLIIKEEKKLNNDLIGYNGMFPDVELGTCSLYEYIYSLRDSVDSPFPNLQSQSVVKGLEMLKAIKDEISSRDVFIQDNMFTFEKLYNKSLLFAKLWYLGPIDGYGIIPLPGSVDGVSGTIIGGFDLGINANISDEKKKAAATVIQFLTSMENQKKVAMKYYINTVITSLYDDEDVCKVKDCELFKKLQFIARPSTNNIGYSSWSTKFRTDIYSYLFDDSSLSDVLKDVEKLTENYTNSSYSLKPFFGIFIFIIIYTIVSIFAQL